MIGILNGDSSFFEITSEDINLDELSISKNLISLSITEQKDAMTQGSLSFYDPDDIFSRILRTGVNIFVSWGYKNSLLKTEIVNNKYNLDEINGSLVRRGLQGFISSPSGNGSSSGVITYNCNFTAYKFRGLEDSRIYSDGTKKDVITDVFDRIGVSQTKRYIDFSVSTDRLDTERSVRQDETDFQFLSRLAREWQVMFAMGFSGDSEVVAIFMDTNLIGNNKLPTWISNATGSSHAIGYKGNISNVISYSWTSNESENGTGSNTQLDFVDGQVVIKRFVTEQESIISYRLNTEKIRTAIQGAEIDGVAAQTKFVKDLLSTKDFEQIEKYFDPISSQTAPQGFGYRINAQMIGNPLFMPPNQVIINNGFPDRLGGSQTKYYIDKVTHKIDKSGYKMGVEIVDIFSYSSVGLGVL